MVLDDGTGVLPTRRSARQAPAPAEKFSVADHTIDEVKEYAEANPDKVGDLLGAEKRTSEPRKTLIEWLESHRDSSDLL